MTLTNDHDAWSAELAEVEQQRDEALSDLEIARRTIAGLNAELIRRSEEHAKAVFAAQESARALRDLTVRCALEKKAVVK